MACYSFLKPSSGVLDNTRAIARVVADTSPREDDTTFACTVLVASQSPFSYLEREKKYLKPNPLLSATI